MFIELAFFLSFLYDFFNISGYGRIIDIIIFSFLPIYIVLNNFGTRSGVIQFKEFLIWLIIFAISCQSLFSRDYRSLITIFALVGGYLTYLVLRLIRYIPNLKTIRRIGYLIMSIQFIEGTIYYIFGISLNIVGYFGTFNNRALNESVGIFRPSSLYQEPNSLCVALFFIFSLTILVPKRDLLENKLNTNEKFFPNKDILNFIRNNIKNNLNFLLLITLFSFLSASLWGSFISIIFLIVIFTATFLSRNNLKKTKKIQLSLFSFIVGLTVFGFSNLLNIKVFRNTYLLLNTQRLSNLENDSSALARYSYGSIFEKLDALSLKEFLIGNGASTSAGEASFQSFLGANGYGFLLYSIGLTGIFLFLTVIFIALAKYKNRSTRNFLKMYLLIISLFAILISTYPFFTYSIFWVWLAINVNCSHFYLERST